RCSRLAALTPVTSESRAHPRGDRYRNALCDSAIAHRGEIERHEQQSSSFGVAVQAGASAEQCAPLACTDRRPFLCCYRSLPTPKRSVNLITSQAPRVLPQWTTPRIKGPHCAPS